MRRGKPKPQPCPYCGERVLTADRRILPHLTRQNRMCAGGGKPWPRARREAPRQERLV